MSKDLLELFETIRSAEVRLWAGLSREMLAQIASEQLIAENMRVYGEILFLLAGLKSCVIFSDMPEKLVLQIINEVLRPSKLLERPDVTLQRIKAHGTASTVLGGSWVLMNNAHPLSRRFSGPNETHPLLRGGERLSESLLAELLDYPVAVSDDLASASNLCEIAYAGMEQGKAVVYTTFMMQDQQLPLVKAHFQRYQDAVHHIVHLKLLSL